MSFSYLLFSAPTGNTGGWRACDIGNEALQGVF
jgi:hypothetical protein